MRQKCARLYMTPRMCLFCCPAGALEGSSIACLTRLAACVPSLAYDGRLGANLPSVAEHDGLEQQQQVHGEQLQRYAATPRNMLQHLVSLACHCVGGLSTAHQHQQMRMYQSRARSEPRQRRIDRYWPSEEGQQQEEQQQQREPRRQRHQRCAQKQQQQHHAQKQHQPRQQDIGAPVDAALLTHRLSTAQTPSELIKLFVRNVESINHIHVIAALTRAANLWDKTGLPAAATTDTPSSSTTTQQHQETDVQRQQLQQLLQHLTGPFMRGMPYYQGREISSGLWAYARCGQPVPDGVIAAAAQQLSSWDTLSTPKTTTQHLVNLSWAAATLGCKDRQLYSTIAAAAQQKLPQLTASQVSVLAWTLARAGVREQQLMEGLAERARSLLEQQLQYYQQQAAGEGDMVGKRSRGQAMQLRFAPGGLTGLSWAFGSAWKWHDAALFTAVAAVSSQVPLVYDFKPHEAANLLKGFAIAAGAADMELRYGSTAGSGGDHTAAGEEDSSAVVTTTAQQDGRPATAATAPVIISNYWSAAVSVAAAVLRRQDEATASSYVRIMWALAELQGHRQQHGAGVGSAAAAAGPDGSSVFEQTCTAVQRCWQRQPAEPQTVLLATWALVQAQHNNLTPQTLLPTSSSSAGQYEATSPSQQLLRVLSNVVVSLANQDLMKPHQLADLAAAYVKLQQHTGVKLLPAGAVTGGQDQQLQRQGNSSSGKDVMLEGLPEAMTPEQQVSAAMEQQALRWDAAAASGVPGQQELAAAVHAVAAAAKRIGNGPAVDEMRLQDAVRLLASLGKLQVRDTNMSANHAARHSLQDLSSAAEALFICYLALVCCNGCIRCVVGHTHLMPWACKLKFSCLSPALIG